MFDFGNQPKLECANLVCIWLKQVTVASCIVACILPQVGTVLFVGKFALSWSECTIPK